MAELQLVGSTAMTASGDSKVGKPPNLQTFLQCDAQSHKNYKVYLYSYNVGRPFPIAKLVNITSITMVYQTYNHSIHGINKPTNITIDWGGHIVQVMMGKNSGNLLFPEFR